jgi:hypothetical protein
MRWGLLLLMALVLEACTATPRTLSPALETELRALVRTRCVPGAAVLPRAITIPADTRTSQEAG